MDGPTREQQAFGGAAVALRREASLLGRCRHPGVIELRSVSDTGEGVAIITATPAGTPLSDTPLTADETAGVVALLATTVADLHDIGVAHGGLCPDVVTIGLDGRPTLGDFSRAVAIEDRSRRRDPARQADDQALGVMLTALIAAASDAQNQRSRSTVETLDRLGGAAEVGRLTARQLADAIARDIPSAVLPPNGSQVPRAQSHGTRHDRALRLMLIPVVAITLIAAIHSRGRGRAPRPTHRAANPATLTTIANPPTRTSPQASGVCAASAGCAPLDYAGDILTVEGRRFAVGSPGDEVAVGRWGCASATTLALLRPSTGTVWVFPAWPSAGATVVAFPEGVVAAATTISTGTRDGCDVIVVHRSDGTSTDLAGKA